MLEFRLFGFPIRVQPWFWLTMAFIGGALRATGPQEWSGVVLFVAAGFVSILIHELGHAFTARRFKCTDVSVSLVALGGVAMYHPPAGGLSRPQSIGISAGGPLLQIAIGVIASFTYSTAVLGILLFVLGYDQAPDWATQLLGSTKALRIEDPNHWAVSLLSPFVNVSIFWGLINLCLPIFPLDGGQILHGILGPKRVRITLYIGLIFCALLAVGTARFFGFSLWNLMIIGLLASQNIKMLKEVNHFKRHQQ